MTARLTFRFAAATLLTVCALFAQLPIFGLGVPDINAQVGVPYSSSLRAHDGRPPYTFSILSGSLPPGLTLNGSSGAITGTPTTAGTFTFTGQATDTPLPTEPAPGGSGLDARGKKRDGSLAQSGVNTATTSGVCIIIVASAAPSPTPVPPSVWMAMTGLAGAGLFHLRQKRRG